MGFSAGRYEINYGDDLTDQVNEYSLRIVCEDSKATVAGWSYLDKYIISGHENGSVSQWDAKVRNNSKGHVTLSADLHAEWLTHDKC